MNPCVHWEGENLKLRTHVQPGARSDEIVGLHGDALKIRLAAPALEGRANARLLRFVADLFSVPLQQVTLVRGVSGRSKQICVHSPRDVPTFLQKLATFQK
ncbi:DUF167 domain-containing protein YggU (modular protein) [Gammaproteobacteria bacterium]